MIMLHSGSLAALMNSREPEGRRSWLYSEVIGTGSRAAAQWLLVTPAYLKVFGTRLGRMRGGKDPTGEEEVQMERKAGALPGLARGL
jgi:hypothetical protein